MATLQDAMAYVVNADDEGALMALSRMAVDRVKLLRSIEGASLTVGDRVELHGIKPKYLTGLVGTVVAYDNRGFKVELDDGQYTGRYTTTMSVPAAALRKVA